MTAGPAGRWTRGALVVVGTLLLAVLTTVAFAVFDTTTVDQPSDLRSVGFGWPFDWMTQDLSNLDPPLPFRQGMAGPMSHGTRHSSLWFSVDVVLIWAAMVASALGTRRRLSARRRTPAATGR